ncbi:unnamed protein product [Polarella glacialis]|uniref:Glutathione transferase n=1 Tax=Polarella glacialis TaxID=89957 RepID=A0A813LG73_POLGL|nr:unnamed protein product [Polarella glacialis]CAE8632944.1 unnamed protein product [Polarella glacialis]CAE8725046.1 unnamed protein product [Polarella glacialis]
MAPAAQQSGGGPHRLRRVLSHLVPAPTAGSEGFVPLEEAAKLSGLRITLIPGVPGIYAECLKNFLDCKGVPYARALHPLMGRGDNQAFLHQLTAQKSLPTMLYNDENPRNSWVEQVVLADKLGKGPSLIPSDPEDRVLMFGLMNELLGEDGIVWRKRLLFGQSAFTAKYGWSDSAATEAPAKIAESLRVFTEQLRKQQEAGSKYLIGNSLCALDIYFATCSYMLAPPGPDMLPRTKENKGLLMSFASNPPEVQAVLDSSPFLIEYRDRVLKTHCVIPADLGGTPL